MLNFDTKRNYLVCWSWLREIYKNNFVNFKLHNLPIRAIAFDEVFNAWYYSSLKQDSMVEDLKKKIYIDHLLFALEVVVLESFWWKMAGELKGLM